MKELIFRFAREENGQDLVEYTLLLAFVRLASAALFINAGASLATVWEHADTIANLAAICAAAAVS